MIQKVRDWLRGKSLKPTWEFTTEGIVWRLVPTTIELLVGEERDIEQRRVSFFCLDQARGRPLWQKMTFGDQWWVGIEAVHDGVLLLHGFASPDLPEHRGIIAVDLKRGQTLWSAQDLAFFALRGAFLYVTRARGMGVTILEVDLHTGTLSRELQADQKLVPGLSPDLPYGVVFPTPIDVQAEDSEVAALLRRSILNQPAVGPAEVVQQGNVIIVGYYEQRGTSGEGRPALDNVLRILDQRSGASIFDVTLEANVQAVVPDSFFVQNNILLYVKDRQTITAVCLPGHSR